MAKGAATVTTRLTRQRLERYSPRVSSLGRGVYHAGQYGSVQEAPQDREQTTSKSQQPKAAALPDESTDRDREHALADAEWKNLWDATEVIDMDKWWVDAEKAPAAFSVAYPP